MIPSNPVPQVCNYGTSATYRDLPNEEQLRNGVVPLDSLPAAWWNCMWNMTNGAINCARYAAGVLIDEINTVLTRAGVCVNCGCVDQLYQAIDKIRQTIGTASVAGAVKSSSTASEVAIDPTTGIMSVNCLGNAASLTTTAATVVGAINELKSTYDSCISSLDTAVGGKAPTSHASSANTYGVGSATDYGHLKISDVYNNSNCQGTDIAASQKAVYCAWKVASDAAAGNISLGNTAGCALGTAAAGSAATAARSDHVHPAPTCVMDYCNSTNPLYVGYAGTGLSCAQVSQLAAFSTSYVSGKTIIKDVSKAVLQSWLGLGSAAYCGTSSFRSSTWLPTALGGIAINPGACASYNEGIRINVANNCFATLNIGGAANSVCGAGGFWIGTNCATSPGKLYVNYGASNKASYFQCNADGTVYWCGNVCGALAGCACCAGRDGSGCSFGTAARCAATAFRASDWWPNCLCCGCVCTAYCASKAAYADQAYCGCSFGNNLWNGRSNKSGTCWCACWNTSCNGNLTFCNCGYGILIYNIKNGYHCVAGIVPSYGKTATVSCMCCGTSCAQAWYIY